MIRHLSLFSGIESFKKAMDNLGIDNELVGFSEIDKWAITALCVIHGVEENLNHGDITKIDETKLPDCDLITYGFPCQDISVAGLGKGIVKGETRSGLLHDALRIIKYKKPKYAIAENVKNLVGKKFKDDFDDLLEELESYGYNNYWQVLNAKDYGIPQNRERVFIVSIRKDVDDGKFEFPQGFDNRLRLKDLLLDEVEEKYYLNNEKTDNLLSKLEDIEDKQVCKQKADEGLRFFKDECIGTIRTINSGGDKRVIEPTIVASRDRKPGNLSDRTTGSPTEQRLEPNTKGTTNMITTVQKDNLVLEPNKLKLHTNLSGGKWDRISESNSRVYDEEGIAPTITTCSGGHTEPKVAVKETTMQSDYKIRKLTPQETFRLMGFSDNDYWKVRRALEEAYYNGGDRSNSQMYKMAGNSIVVDVLEAIFKQLF